MKRSLRLFFRRPTSAWEGLILTGVLVLGISIFLEIISFNHNVRVDLTPTKSYSLSDLTINILRRMDKDIQFTAFYRQGERKEFDEFFRRLSLYTPHVRYKLFDLDRNPGQAKLHGIATYGQTLVEWEGKKEILSYPAEEIVINLLIKTIRRGKREVYFTGGHGENSPEKEYLSLSDVLKVEGWQVSVIDLAGKENIPAGDSLLIVGGPKTDFSDEELRKAAQYLEEGGKIILMIEPFVHLPKIKAFLEKFRIGLGDGIIVDNESKLRGGDYLAPFIPNFANSPITNLFKSPAIFPTARPLEIKGGEIKGGGNFISYLAKSYATSWIRKGEGKGNSERTDFEEGVDQKGPVPVAVIASVFSGKTNQAGTPGALACFGDSDFVNNEFIEMLVNKDLFMNTVNWLGMERELISIRPSKYEFPFYYLTKKQGQWAFWFLVVIIPAIPLTTGLGIFLYRKWRG
ncbi:MAG: Gldg family protein [Syntrophales bacterium]|nr:Gldg family protein [Syntrophales bacterium]